MTTHPPFEGDVYIDLLFKVDELRGDAVFAWHPTSAINIDTPLDYYLNPSAHVKYTSPMEVEINGDYWAPAVILSTPDREKTLDHPLAPNSVPSGYNVVSVQPGVSRSNIRNITGIRYAWRDTPCCPLSVEHLEPCNPGSCPITTLNSTLPAMPFYAKIENGKCKCFAPFSC